MGQRDFSGIERRKEGKEANRPVSIISQKKANPKNIIELKAPYLGGREQNAPKVSNFQIISGTTMRTGFFFKIF